MTFNQANFHFYFCKEDPVMSNALQRHGIGLDELAKFGPEETDAPLAFTTHSRVMGPEQWRSWYDLIEIRNVGPKRVLNLVNFLRRNGTELPWFRAFDAASADWKVLRGKPRYTPLNPE